MRSGSVPPSPLEAQAHHDSWSTGEWVTGFAAVLVALGIFLSLLMGSLDQFVVLTALNRISADLGQPNGVTFVVSAYLMTSTVAIPIFARLSDILSRRSVFLVGVGIFVAGSILAGLSQTLTELIVFRGVQGFGSGCFFPVGISIIAVAFPPERRARLTGLFSAVFGIATVAGPFIGDYIVTYSNWRWVFYINIPIGLVGAGVLASSLGALRPEHKEPFDLPGAALLSAWAGALILALFQVSNGSWGWTDGRVLALLGAFAIVLAVFIVYELRARHPLLPLRLFLDRVVGVSNLTAAFARGAVFSLLTLISFYVGSVLLHNAPGSPDTVRDTLYFMVLPIVVAGFISGNSLTRIPYRPIVATGTALIAVGLYFLAQITPTTPLWQFAYGFVPVGGLVLPLMPIGFGLGLTFAPTVLAVQYRVARKDVGQATGLVQFIGSLAAAVALSLFTSYEAATAPAPPLPSCFVILPTPPGCLSQFTSWLDGTVPALRTIFLVMLGMAIVAFVASLFLTGRLPRRPGADPSAPPT